jgi:hypothetical protein
MALSDTARRILAEAAQHPLRLATPPQKLPVAACRVVLGNLLKQGYVEECTAPMEYVGLGWRRQDGGWAMIRATEAGLAAIGGAPADTAVDGAEQEATQVAAGTIPADMAQKPGSAPLGAPTAPEALPVPTAAEAAQRPSTRPSLRDAAHRVLGAWDDEAGKRAKLPDAIAALRAVLVKPARAPRATEPRKPREGTKQQQVLSMLRRPEGATVAQIMQATGWQAHTVRGFFAGLKKRGIQISVLERFRQVGPGKEGAKGSYTIYHLAEAG